MVDAVWRRAFEQAVSEAVSPDRLSALAASVRAGGEGADLLAPAFFRAAFIDPLTLARTYDAAAAGWLGEPVGGPDIAVPAMNAEAPKLAASAELWDVFWRLSEDSAGGLSALEITPRTAALAGYLSPDFAVRQGEAYYAYPEVRKAAARGLPRRFKLDDLAACPEGSLGYAFHRQIIDNQFDLEVLDRDAMSLSSLPPPHDFINTRMLQSHDLIHILAGYELTTLHEIGISAFQMAQCGHSYSAMFLALVAATSATSPQPGAFAFLMDTVLGAWIHGRRSPSIMDLDWESVWDQPLETLRSQLGIRRFESIYPPDIIEQLVRAA